jgi:hypothetical protein
LEFWKLNIMRNEMYTKAIGLHIEHKEGILESYLSKPLPKQSPILLEGFEPFSNWKVKHVQFFFNSTYPWRSRRSNYPFILWAEEHETIFEYVVAYTPFRYLHEKDFILVCPSNFETYPIWMGKVHSDVVKDGNDKHYRMVHVRW